MTTTDTSNTATSTKPGSPQHPRVGRQVRRATSPTVAPPGPSRDPRPTPLSRGRAGAIVTGLLLATLAAALDSTMLPSVLQAVDADLNAGNQWTWVAPGYFLAVAAGMPLFGTLGDTVGRKKLFMVAATIFVFGAALASWSPGFSEYIAFRMMQGIGTAGILVGAQSIVAGLTTPRRSAPLLGIVLGVFGLASFTGPLLGAVLVDRLTWRWCCYVEIPVIVLSLACVGFAGKIPGPPRALKVRPDVVGALLLSCVTACVSLLVILGGTRYAWDSAVMLSLLGGTGVAIAVFMVVERYVRPPAVPLRLFRDRSFVVTSIVAALIGVAVFGVASYLPVSLQLIRGTTSMETGTALLPLGCGFFFAALVAGATMRKTVSYRIFLALGIVIAMVGIGRISALTADTPQWQVTVALAAIGVSAGLVMPVVVLAAQNVAGPCLLGVTTAMTNYFWQCGAFLGAVATGALVHDRLGGDVSALTAGSPAWLDDNGELPLGLARTADGLAWLLPHLDAEGIASFAAGLPPTFRYAVPVLLAGLLIACVLEESTLRTSRHVAWNARAGDRPGDTLTTEHSSPEPSSPEQRGPGNRSQEPPHTESRNPNHVGPSPAATPPAQTPAATPPVASTTEPDTALDTAPDAPTGDSDHGSPGPRRIQAVVRRSDGRPLPGVVLTLCDIAGEQVGRSVAAGGGRYELTAPSPAPYLLIASAHAHHPYAQVVDVRQDPTTVELTMTGETGIHGMVKNATGEPVAAAAVTLADHDGEVVLSGATATSGGYLLGDVEPGAYTLAVTAPGYRASAQVVHIPETQKVRCDVELTGGGRLHGTVSGGRAGRISDVRLTLVDGWGRVVRATASGPSGHYRFDELPEGDYTLVASMYPPCASEIHVAAGHNHQHDVELRYPEPDRQG
ncbi:MFS transporter [Actinopolymorpha sp. B17G11]|uniref:MFS transporter n=1 Tax=Actinopolymorpha sp. B17G11 TaxID=3160861 RepID=UPI0032E42B10